MKAALYFVGASFLIWAAVIWWAVTLILGAVGDINAVVAKAPLVLERAETVVADIKDATDGLASQLERARAALPEALLPQAETARKLAETGIDAVRAFSRKTDDGEVQEQR